MKRINTSAGNTTFELEATSEMCPNTYIAVTLLQPHNNRDNDRPIRMYGVVNIHVEDPALHFESEDQNGSGTPTGKRVQRGSF